MLGVFDSGVGGLSVLRHLPAALPGVPLVYVADTVNVPYGPRPLAEVRAFSHAITRFLLDRGATEIVVACNTASAAALTSLRQAFPHVPFVGMEPAIKPAAEQTHSGVVGVLATPATFQGELFASVVERFARDVRVIRHTCPGLVEQIEAGRIDTADTEAMLRSWVEPMLAGGIDALVLGCTHYPFVIPLLERICGPDVRVIDPAPAVARQAARLWPGTAAAPGLTYGTTGDVAQFDAFRARVGLPSGTVQGLTWRKGALVPREDFTQISQLG
jgi:glutamate racemase